MFGPSSLSYPPKTPLQTEKHAPNNFHNFKKTTAGHLVLSRKRSIKLTLRSLSLDPRTWESNSRYIELFFGTSRIPNENFQVEFNVFTKEIDEFTFDCFCLFCLVFWCFCFFLGGGCYFYKKEMDLYQKGLELQPTCFFTLFNDTYKYTWSKLLRFFCIWRSSTFWGMMRHQKDQRNCQDKSCLEKKNNGDTWGYPPWKEQPKPRKHFPTLDCHGLWLLVSRGSTHLPVLQMLSFKLGFQLPITGDLLKYGVDGWLNNSFRKMRTFDDLWVGSFTPNSEFGSDPKTLRSSPMTSKTSPVRFGVLG